MHWVRFSVVVVMAAAAAGGSKSCFDETHGRRWKPWIATKRARRPTYLVELRSVWGRARPPPPRPLPPGIPPGISSNGIPPKTCTAV